MRLWELDDYFIEEARIAKGILDRHNSRISDKLKTFLAFFPDLEPIWVFTPVYTEYDRLWWAIASAISRWEAIR